MNTSTPTSLGSSNKTVRIGVNVIVPDETGYYLNPLLMLHYDEYYATPGTKEEVLPWVYRSLFSRPYWDVSLTSPIRDQFNHTRAQYSGVEWIKDKAEVRGTCPWMTHNNCVLLVFDLER